MARHEYKAVVVALLSLGWSDTSSAGTSEHSNAVSFYAGRISSVNAWHDLIKEPNRADFVDAYVAVVALSHTLGRFQ